MVSIVMNDLKLKKKTRPTHEVWSQKCYKLQLFEGDDHGDAGNDDFSAIYQTLPLGSKSSIFDQIWSFFLFGSSIFI